MANHEKCTAALAGLKARGFPVPPALANLDAPRPLALTTRQDCDAYVAEHGGGAEEAKILGQVIMTLVHTTRYQESIAADLSERVTLDGKPAGLVSESDRLSAALQLNAKALRGASTSPKPPPPQPPKPPPPPPAASQASSPAKPTSSPFRNGGSLSPVEVEKRRQALAALKPRATA